MAAVNGNRYCGEYLWCKAILKNEEKIMDKKEQERINRQKNLNEYNSVTQKVKPENQNQSHNVRKEGIQPINQKR